MGVTLDEHKCICDLRAQTAVLKETLSQRRLHGSKPEAALWVTFDDELDGPSTKITDAVKEYYRVVFHFLFS